MIYRMSYMCNVKTNIIRKYFVWLLFAVCLFFLPTYSVQSASLSITPDTGVYTVGDTVSVRVVLNTAGQTINAADGRIQVSGSGVNIVSLNQTGSIFSLWTEEPQIRGNEVVFSGGIPQGYTGNGGTVFTLTLRTSSAGTKRITFQDGSVLAADGRGSNVLSNMSGATYTVRARETAPEPEVVRYVPVANTPDAPRITSETHPDQDTWSSASDATFAWTVPAGITQVRTAVTQSPSTIPNEVADGIITSYTVSKLPDGVSYFHLQLRNEDGWGDIARYRIFIDSKPPQGLVVKLDESIEPYRREQQLLIDVSTSTSPLVEAVVQIAGKDPLSYPLDSSTSTIALPVLDPGYYTLTVEVRNASGLSSIVSLSLTIQSFEAPILDAVPNTLDVGVIPVFTGTTRPNSELTGLLTKVSNGVEVEYYSSSDTDGRFHIILDDSLQSGVYEFTVTAVDDSGASSDMSRPVRFMVTEPGYVQFGNMMVSLLSIVVPTVALFIVLILSLWYGLYRWKMLRKRVARESQEAHMILQEEFENIHNLLDNEEVKLTKSRKTGSLTKAETNLLDNIRKQLNTSLKKVEKEVEDVEDLVPHVKDR